MTSYTYPMQTPDLPALALSVQQAILAHEADIECLDRDIGDGDHYINIKRGCEAVVGLSDHLAMQSFADGLHSLGMKLLSTIGGASGPLFASLFMRMGKSLQGQELTQQALASAFAEGVEAMMQRGKAQAGEKTMLDVLIPVSQCFSSLAAQDQPAAVIAQHIKQVASEGLEATRAMLATKGRAAGLGERAIGHLDAGAKSCEVILHSLCDAVLSQQPHH